MNVPADNPGPGSPSLDADLAGDYQALRMGVGAVWLARDAVRVTGSEAAGFLQGQLSQDLQPLEDGDSVWSLILQPQGKIDALVRVSRLAEDDFVLDTDGGWGDAVVARLLRFKLRVRADLEPLAWSCLGLRGQSDSFDSRFGSGLGVGPAGRRGTMVVAAAWPGLASLRVDGLDLLGPGPTVSDVAADGADAVRVCSAAAHEALRIEAGQPAMGRELTDRTIPAEAGVVPHTVSFTKGCFTGQELVARIDSRGGNVPRRLRGVVVSGRRDEPSPPLPAGAALVVGGKEVGSLTSTAYSPGLVATVALAYLHRDVAVPAEAEVHWPDGRAPARIEELPLLS